MSTPRTSRSRRISWRDAVEFCQQLTQRERDAGRLPDGWAYRLPTKAQWEYACRAGSTSATAFGPSLTSWQANFDGGAPYNTTLRGAFRNRTCEIGSYSGNDWGLHDCHGNVSEWCLDTFRKNIPGGDDPIVTESDNPKESGQSDGEEAGPTSARIADPPTETGDRLTPAATNSASGSLWFRSSDPVIERTKALPIDR